jgi:hypothetical protein
VALAFAAAIAGCNVYDSQLIGSALGPGGATAVGSTGGTSAGTAGRGGGNGGTAGVPATGGKAGVGGTTGGTGGAGAPGYGGSGATGATGGTEGGSDGDGGEDPGVGGTAGTETGGQGGAGGATAGSGGTGADAGSGGGGAGAAGTAGSGGGETCSGCARLSVPLAASGDRAHFALLLPAATDLSAATITFRIANIAGTGGSFKGYIQEGAPDYVSQFSNGTTLASLTSDMQEITWNVASAGTAADKTQIRRIGIEIMGSGGSSWTNPTIVYVDRIVVTGSSLTPASYPFDTTDTVYTTPTGQGPTGALYLNDHPGDTNVTGAALSWLGP